jgi:hypothetical protein
MVSKLWSEELKTLWILLVACLLSLFSVSFKLRTTRYLVLSFWRLRHYDTWCIWFMLSVWCCTRFFFNSCLNKNSVEILMYPGTNYVWPCYILDSIIWGVIPSLSHTPLSLCSYFFSHVPHFQVMNDMNVVFNFDSIATG